MIQVKTMTKWKLDDYGYPLPDVSHFPEHEAHCLRCKGDQFITFGDREQIKSDEEFENCITLSALKNWKRLEKDDKENYKRMVMADVKHNRFLWYHGRYLMSLREKYLPPLVKN